MKSTLSTACPPPYEVSCNLPYEVRVVCEGRKPYVHHYPSLKHAREEALRVRKFILEALSVSIVRPNVIPAYDDCLYGWTRIYHSFREHRLKVSKRWRRFQ